MHFIQQCLSILLPMQMLLTRLCDTLLIGPDLAGTDLFFLPLMAAQSGLLVHVTHLYHLLIA